MTFQVGDWVEVRSKEEILQSLDKLGRYQDLPLMPQMLKYCGQRFKVHKRAHKTCDTANKTGSRRLIDSVHLDLRCDGAAYGGCQAACLLFWKEAWLKPAAEAGATVASPTTAATPVSNAMTSGAGCTEEDIWKATQPPDRQRPTEITYACQATELPGYTTRLRYREISQFWEDYTSGNASLGQLLRGFLYLAYFYGTQAWRTDRVGQASRKFYDRVQSLWGGVPFPRYEGQMPVGSPQPIHPLDLQPGDVVRVKSYEAILATIDTNNNHRGMKFDAEMVPFCGRTYRVQARVSKFLNEKTGRMLTLKTPAVILEGVWCQARYSHFCMFCPRAIYSWWREEWLEKVSEAERRPRIEVADEVGALVAGQSGGGRVNAETLHSAASN